MARGPGSASSHAPTADVTIIDPLLLVAATTDPKERHRLVEQATEEHLDLADSLARQYAHRGIDLDDLTQVARLGLMLAVERFRPDSGASFEAFAVPTIRGELRRHFRDHGWVVRPPRRVQELRVVVRRAREEFEQAEGREPTTTELARLLDVAPCDVQECSAADTSYSPLSLDATSAAQDTPLSERLGHEAPALEILPDQLALRRALSHLSKRDRRVLAWRFGDCLTQSEIGRRLGVSQMQVSRILSGIILRLRAALDVAEAS